MYRIVVDVVCRTLRRACEEPMDAECEQPRRGRGLPARVGHVRRQGSATGVARLVRLRRAEQFLVRAAQRGQRGQQSMVLVLVVLVLGIGNRADATKVPHVDSATCARKMH